MGGIPVGDWVDPSVVEGGGVVDGVEPSVLAWNAGGRFFRYGKRLYRFDRVLGPFGLIRPSGEAVWKVCVRRLGEGDVVRGPVDVRVEAERVVRDCSKLELVERLNGSGNGRSKRWLRNCLRVQLLCEAGVPPVLPDDFEMLADPPPGSWGSGHRLDLNSGLVFTAGDELCDLDGSVWKGRGFYAANRDAQARKQAVRVARRQGGLPARLGAFSDEMELHARWYLDNPNASVEDRVAQAELLGVKPKKLREWEAHPDFQARCGELVEVKLADPLLLNAIIRSLETAVVEHGDVQAARQLLDLKNKVNPFKPVTRTDDVSTVSGLSDEELAELAGPLSFREIITGKADGNMV